MRFLWVAIAISAMTSAALAQNLDSVVHYWDFDTVFEGDIVKDKVGENDGFLEDTSVTLGPTVNLGNALAFDGFSQVVFSQPLTFEADFTVTAWASAEDWDPGIRQNIMDSWSPGGPAQWYRLGFEGGGFEFVADSGTAIGTREYVVTNLGIRDPVGNQEDPLELEPESWHHIAGVRDLQRGELVFYVDAVEVNSIELVFDEPIEPLNLSVGSAITCPGIPDDPVTDCEGREFWTGNIDEFGLFNAALTQSDIQSLMQDGLVLGDPLDTLTGQERIDYVHDQLGTWVGDSNLDGEFNSGDLVDVFTSGKFESGEAAVWAEGDWDGDGLFNSGDFVAAFSDGGFEVGPRPMVNAVPEPSPFMLIAIGLLALLSRNRH